MSDGVKSDEDGVTPARAAQPAPVRELPEALIRCPMQFLRECRSDTPIVQLTSSEKTRNGFLITKHQDIATACRDPAAYSSIGNPQSDGWAGSDEEAAAIYRNDGWPLRRVLVWNDPPDHTRIRKHIDRIFTVSRVAARAEHIRVCIDKVASRFAAGGTIDGVGDFAAQLPAMVMTREFGAPEDDFPYLIETTNLFARTIEFTQEYGLSQHEIAVEGAKAATRFQQYMLPRIEAARRHPENTMLSEMVNARDDNGEPALTLQEIQSLLIVFLIAATHSTTGGIAWALHCLAEYPDVQARLRREPEKIEAFVEEVLRMHGSVATSFRTSTRDTQLGNVALPAHSQMFLRWDSANYDADKWSDPFRFDIDRKGIRNHMTFGYGIHFCVGNTLARKQMAMVVQAFLERFSAIRSAGENQLLESFGLHVLTKLPLQLSV